MSRLRIRIDRIACDGRGLCAEILPELISLDDWGFPIVKGGVVPEEIVGVAEDAVEVCPKLALWLEAVMTEDQEKGCVRTQAQGAMRFRGGQERSSGSDASIAAGSRRAQAFLSSFARRPRAGNVAGLPDRFAVPSASGDVAVTLADAVLGRRPATRPGSSSRGPRWRSTSDRGTSRRWTRRPT